MQPDAEFRRALRRGIQGRIEPGQTTAAQRAPSLSASWHRPQPHRHDRRRPRPRLRRRPARRLHRRLGERFDETIVEPIPFYSYSEGRAAMLALLERDPSTYGVFAASDALAAGAMEALRSTGRSVPRDTGVVGFDDSAWGPAP